MGRMAVDSNMLFIDGLKVPGRTASARRAGGSSTFCTHEPGAHPDRPPRRRSAAPRWPRAARYAASGSCSAADRPEPGHPHPLAERWIELEAAELLMLAAGGCL